MNEVGRPTQTASSSRDHLWHVKKKGGSLHSLVENLSGENGVASKAFLSWESRGTPTMPPLQQTRPIRYYQRTMMAKNHLIRRLSLIPAIVAKLAKAA